MKKIFLVAAAILTAAIAHATDVPAVIVNMLSGQAHTEAMATVAKIDLTDGTLSIVAKADGAVLYSQPINKCKSIVFGTAKASALPDVLTDAAKDVTITPEPGAHAVRISGLADGQPVHVYSLSGTLEISGTAPLVSLTGLQQGVHIVVAGPAAAKVTVK